ncbi:hypothetical protein SteCoe_25911 [Stentor coeruleus]|uniref:RCC1-like domain-containing protein n=1 Tax=Stentor coeruleus TaxID=5963 RepID=A0A1R2BE86_9CILI|nr:hypothetical protein SteCoe_25911 [Stentor coeruleus]
MDAIKVQQNYLSCSEGHAAAVGTYGQIYVWGKNYYDRVKEKTVKSDSPSQSSSELNSDDDENKKKEESSESDLYFQLGFNDNEIDYIEKPVYYSLTHPLYRVNASQVQCGPNFTAIVAKEKPNVLIDEETNEDDENFAKEIDENITEQPPYNLTPEEKKNHPNIFLTNHIRQEIVAFLRSKKIEFMDYFKSRIIKESTFIDLMKTEIHSQFTTEQIRNFINFKKMRLPGKGITLRPLYELVYKCKQSRGVLYILGRKDLIIPQRHGQLSAELIKEFTLCYYLINLPESVCCAKVCCGLDFVIVLSFDGFVYSWGTKGSASLGKNRSPTCRNIKLITGLVTERVYVKDISCGFSHCMALMSSGFIMTWGNGDHGKLGNGRLENSSRPENIGADLGDIEFIKAGANSSFCKCKDGNSYFWGEANDCKFGNEIYKTYFEKPEQFTYTFDIIDIAIGKNYCVIIERVGFLNQIGKGTIVCLNKKHKELEGASFYQVAGAGNSFLALSNKGCIYSWTLENECSILGRDDSITASLPGELTICSQQFPTKDDEDEVNEEQTVKENSTKIVKVYCLEENTMLLTDKGEVIASGTNKYGQMAIAYGDIEDYSEDNGVYSTFTLIPRLSTTSKVCITSMACGAFHVIGICKDGKVLSWGANSYGQLGNKALTFSQQFPEIIVSLKSETIVQAAAGLNHSMVLNAKGQVFSFGSAENGKLGQGRLNPTVVYSTPTIIEGLNDIIQISCGASHSLALNKKKALFLWGSGWKGQIGNGKKDTVYDPVLLLINHDWEFATCGTNHTLAINSYKKIYHWGEVCFPEEELEIIQPVPIRGLEEISFKRAFASECHSAALVENGLAVYCWGKQMHKRIASAKPETNDKELCKPIVLSIPGEKISHFSIGQSHGVLVSDQGNVFTWGYTYGGRTGEPTDSKIRTKAFSGKYVDLSRYLSKGNKAEDSIKEQVIDIQLLLQNEPDELNELNIREVDKQIAIKFNDCIDKFVELTASDKNQESFFVKVEHKMLSRLQQDPFKCKLVSDGRSNNSDTENRLIFYSSLVTTYQIHVCYMFKLMTLKLDEKKKIEMLNLIYCDMEKDYRLIYTSIYLARMLLNKLLEKKNAKFPDFFEDPDAVIYKELINKIITASEVDMIKIRTFAETVIQSLSNVVHMDENGIDPNPLNCQKNTPNNTVKISNKITAYQISRNIVDRRMSKLRQLMQYFVDCFRKFVREDEFSDIITLIVKDFINKCTTKFDLKLKKFDYQIDVVLMTTHTILSMIFKPLCDAVQNPLDYYVLVENKQASSIENLNSISDSLRSFFSGIKIGASNERWYSDINEFNLINEKNLELKVELLEKIINKKPELEEMFLESMFLNSLSAFDKEITVSGRSLIRMHSITASNLEDLRVNNPSYDPLILLCKALVSVPPMKTYSHTEQLNLSLYTRALRQDQSIVRCPECEMLIPRDMAPNNFKPVIEVYDPMPPNSPVFLYTKILATGCKKIKKGNINDYLNQYKEICEEYLRDYKSVERVNSLIHCVDTIFAAENDMAIDVTDAEQKAFVEKNREKYFKNIELGCETEFKRRKHHCALQQKLTRIFDHLLDILNEKQKTSSLSLKEKKHLLFNVEYGGSNRDLERFSDSVMFSIFLNKIREYTSKKEMSINLFENLTDEMKESLRGFMKRSLSELNRKGIIKEYFIPENMKPKDIIFSFEVEGEFITMIVTHSKGRLNLCGRDEFRQEELLLYEKIPSEYIAELREEAKFLEKDKITILPSRSFAIKFGFSQMALLDMIGRMEDKIAAYIQNISISLVNIPNSKKKVDKNKTKEEKSNEEDETTRHLQAPDKNLD